MTFLGHNSLLQGPFNFFVSAFNDTKISISEKKGFYKVIYIFWLLGPFILLIERTPADIWLSLISLCFIIKIFIEKDFQFLKSTWVKITFVFWFFCIFSALISSLPIYSTIEAMIWIRFPLFAMAVSYWIAIDKKSINSMLLSILFAIILMMIILCCELFFKGMPSDCRLTWPYGDKVSGNFFSKVGLPIIIIAGALANSINNKFAFLWGLVVLLMLIFSVIIGERMNFLILFCGVFVSSFFWKTKLKNFIIFSFSILATLFLFAQNTTCVNNKVSTKTVIKGEIKPFYSDYMSVMGGGIIVFNQKPIFGIGPGNYRKLSEGYLKNYPNFRADNHPHNFYIQLAAETGVFGLFLGFIMILSILIKVFKSRDKKNYNIVNSTFFVIPLAFFWPLASTADFFGQWNNIFMWSTISIALASRNYN